MSAYVSPKHREALDLIKAYCCDLGRDRSILDRGVDALSEKSQSMAFTPSQRDEALRCIESVELFRRSAKNVFGADGLPLMAAPRFDSFKVRDVAISVQPDLLVGLGLPPETGERLGVVHIRPQKTPDPDGCKRAETKADREGYRREVARYILVLSHMMLKSQGLQSDQIDIKKMVVWDLRMREAIGFPSDRVSRERRIKAACGQISRLWNTIAPKQGDLLKE